MMENIDSSWTLFLDRDGVINKRLMGDYVKKIEEFEFLSAVPSAIAQMNKIFGRVVVVTNQQGIGKGLMTKDDLEKVHHHMIQELESKEAKVDAVYFCPELAEKNAACRKPNIGMAEQAKGDFPEIEFKRSIMVGDSLSDLEFGRNAGMKTVFISDDPKKPENADLIFKSLEGLAQWLSRS